MGNHESGGYRDDLQPIGDSDEGDFAEEHSKPTYADEQAGGPENTEEPESPSDEGGAGGMDLP
jgi:hypothetical protein